MSYAAAFYLLGAAFFCGGCVLFRRAYEALNKARAAREDAAADLETAAHLYDLAESVLDESMDRARPSTTQPQAVS